MRSNQRTAANIPPKTKRELLEIDDHCREAAVSIRRLIAHLGRRHDVEGLAEIARLRDELAAIERHTNDAISGRSDI